MTQIQRHKTISLMIIQMSQTVHQTTQRRVMIRTVATAVLTILPRPKTFSGPLKDLHETLDQAKTEVLDYLEDKYDDVHKQVGNL